MTSSQPDVPSRAHFHRLLIVGALFTSILPVAGPAMAGSFSRSGGKVVYRHGEFEVKFLPAYGASPLEVKYNGATIIHPHAGEGWQMTFDTGNDPTQAGHNGIDPSPIALLNDAATAHLSYYARETVLNSGAYQVAGFFPYFLENYGSDVVIPAGSEGLWILGDRSFGTPLTFAGSPQRPAAFAMAGRELGAGQLAEIREGRVAFQTTVYLGDADPTAFAGVVYRRSVPTSGAITNDGVYYSPGYSLLVNRLGIVQWWGPGGLLLDTGPQAWIRSLVDTIGLQLEIRTHNAFPSYQELWLGGVLMGIIDDKKDPAPHLGRHIGFFAYSPTGVVEFQNRRVFDVSIEAVITHTKNSDASLTTEVVVRNAPFVTSRMSLHRVNYVAFLNPGGDLTSAYAKTTGWTSFATPLLFLPDGKPNPLFAGRSNGKLGLGCKTLNATIDGRHSSGSHALIQNAGPGGRAILHINALPASANQTPIAAREVRLKSRWWPFLMN